MHKHRKLHSFYFPILNVLIFTIISGGSCFNIDTQNVKQHSECPTEFGYSLVFTNEDELAVGAPTYDNNDPRFFVGAVFSYSFNNDEVTIIRRSLRMEMFVKDARFGHSMLYRPPNEFLVCGPYARYKLKTPFSPELAEVKDVVQGFCEYKLSETTQIFYTTLRNSIFPNYGMWVTPVNNRDYVVYSSVNHTLKMKREDPSSTDETDSNPSPQPNLNLFDRVRTIAYHKFMRTIAIPDKAIYIRKGLRNINDLITMDNLINPDGFVSPFKIPYRQPGSGFGHSSCIMPYHANPMAPVSDILIVGDPYMHQNGFTLGAVYYMDLAYGNFNLIATGTASSLFGYNVYCPGDLDGNGYPDLLVSAPYGGSDHRPVVFVYSRFKNEFKMTQIIDVGDFSSSTCHQMFGFSFDTLESNESPSSDTGEFGAIPVLKIAIGSLGTVYVFDVLCSYELDVYLRTSKILNLNIQQFSSSENKIYIWNVPLCINMRQNCDSRFEIAYKIRISGAPDVSDIISFATDTDETSLDALLLVFSKDPGRPNVNSACQRINIFLTRAILSRKYFDLILEDVTSLEKVRKSPYSKSTFESRISVNKLCGNRPCFLSIIATVTPQNTTVFQSANSRINFKLYVQAKWTDADTVSVNVTYDSRVSVLSACSIKQGIENINNNPEKRSCSIHMGSSVSENSTVEQYIEFSTSELYTEANLEFTFQILATHTSRNRSVELKHTINQKLCAGLNIGISPNVINVNIASESGIEAIYKNETRTKLIKSHIYVNHVGISTITESSLEVKYPNISHINSVALNNECCKSVTVVESTKSENDRYTNSTMICVLNKIGSNRQEKCEFTMNISLVHQGVPFNDMSKKLGFSGSFNLTFYLKYNENTYHCDDIENLLTSNKNDTMINIADIILPTKDSHRWHVWIIISVIVALFLGLCTLFFFLRSPTKDEEKDEYEDPDNQMEKINPIEEDYEIII